jgi:signal peptidase I
MVPTFFQRHPVLKDILSLSGFVIAIVIGTITLNSFVFRSYNVVGQSMENTLHADDRIIVNRLPVTFAHLLGKEYMPERGQIIVFVNGDNTNDLLTCSPKENTEDQFIIKRVVAFPGERVTVKEGTLMVYNDEHPDGFSPDEATHKSPEDGPKSYTSGELDVRVPEGEIFVSGDNREGSHSYDSRNGLGTIPFCRIIGPAGVRVYPFDKIRAF